MNPKIQTPAVHDDAPVENVLKLLGAVLFEVAPPGSLVQIEHAVPILTMVFQNKKI